MLLFCSAHTKCIILCKVDTHGLIRKQVAIDSLQNCHVVENVQKNVHMYTSFLYTTLNYMLYLFAFFSVSQI